MYCARTSQIILLLCCVIMNMLFPILMTVGSPDVEVVGEVGPISVELSWNEQSGVEDYHVSYERTGGVINSCPHFVDSGNMTGTATGVTLDNLEEDSVYSVTVTAISTGDSFYTTIEVTTADAGNVYTISDAHTVQYFMAPIIFFLSAPSGPPQNVTITDINLNSIDVDWRSIKCIDRNTEITGYIVRYGPVSDSGDRNEVPADGPSTTFTLTGLSQSTNYSIEVAGNSDLGRGPFSNPIYHHTAKGDSTHGRIHATRL